MLSFFKSGLKKIFHIGKKVFLVAVVYFVVTSLFFYFFNKDRVKITEDPIKKNRVAIYKLINDPQLNKTKEGKLTVSLYKTAICGIIGEACSNNPDDGDKNFKGSLLGKASGLLVSPYANPPASGVMWAYNGLQSAGFIPKTYAAEGLGFAAIRPYANLWKIFRDVAYMFLVLVLIALGFMIMFRAKLNPQTVISVENALPKIVVSLILITFSFAIAGFLIDLMYVSIVLIVSILSNGGAYYNSTQFQNEFIAADSLKLFRDAGVRANYLTLLPAVGGALLGILPLEVVTAIRVIIGGLTVIVLNGLLHINFLGPVANALNGVNAVGTGLGSLPGLSGLILSPILMTILFLLGIYVVFPLLCFIILGGTFVFLVIRIFMLIFTSYIKLILNIVLAPFFLMFEAVPGSKSPFGGWIKNIIGYLMVFPITIAVFLIGYIIVNSTVPPGYNEMRLPYLYGIDSNSFKILIGVGLILMIPDLVKAAKESLGIKEAPIPFGIGTFFGGAGAVVGSATGLLGQFSSINLGIAALGLGGKSGPFGLLGKTKTGGFSAEAEARQVAAIMEKMKIASQQGAPPAST